MNDNLLNLYVLEKEVEQYRQTFQESSDILQSLIEVKSKFSDLTNEYQSLTQQYQALKEYINESKSTSTSLQQKSKTALEELVQANKTFHQSFANLEQKVSEHIIQAQKDVETNLELAQSKVDSKIEEFRTQAVHNFNYLAKEFSKAYSDLENKVKEQVQKFEDSQNSLHLKQKELEVSLKSLINSNNDKATEVACRFENLEQQLLEFGRDISKVNEYIKQTSNLTTNLESRVKEQFQELKSSQQLLRSKLQELESYLNALSASSRQNTTEIALKFESLEQRLLEANQNFISLSEHTKKTWMVAITTFITIVIVVIPVVGLFVFNLQAKSQKSPNLTPEEYISPLK